jgi:hypothetical protein
MLFRLALIATAFWFIACVFVFGGAAPLGVLVFGIGIPAFLWALCVAVRWIDRRRRTPPFYSGRF